MKTNRNSIIITSLSIVIVYLVINLIYLRTHPQFNLINDSSSNITETAQEIYFKGKNYFLKVESNGPNEEVWLRSNKNISNASDIHALTVSFSKTTMKDAGKMICKAKKEIDDGKMIFGCLQTAGIAACAISVVGTEGATAILCTEAWAYSYETGLGACLAGLADKIAEKLEASSQWTAIQMEYNINNGSFLGVMEKSLGLACVSAENAIDPQNTPTPVSAPQPTSTPISKAVSKTTVEKNNDRQRKDPTTDNKNVDTPKPQKEVSSPKPETQNTPVAESKPVGNNEGGNNGDGDGGRIGDGDDRTLP